MKNRMFTRAVDLWWAASCVVLLSACDSMGPIHESRDLWSQGRIEEAVTNLRDALARDPQNHQLKTAYEHERELALAHFAIAADRARGSHDVDQARRFYEAALRLDPNYPRALDGLAQLDALARQDKLVEQARKLLDSGDLAQAQKLLDEVLAQDPNHTQARRLLFQIREKNMLAGAPPALKTMLNKPITLDLHDTPLRNLFDALSQTAGLNFVFDHDVHTDTKITIFIRHNSIEDVLRLVLTTNGLESKILNENTVLIYPNSAGKAREYQDLVVRTFYLTNADTKQVQGLLKTMAHTKDIYVDEKLNLVTIRDTPEAVKLAERLVESVDVAEAEVMLEVEVMELSRTRAQQLGLQFPTQASRGAPVAAGGVAPTTIPTSQIGATITTLTNPLLVANLFAQDTDADLLANPRIRVKNREKAKVLIGEKLPVFTSTAVQNAGVSTSVSYIDIGLKLEVEPQIYLDDEVGIKINMEVNSNLGAITDPTTGTQAYDVGTRTATTVLRLHDGETQVLAGLINDNDRATLSKVPGLGDLPGIGRIFTDTNSNYEKTEIVLLITPRIIRNVVTPDFDDLVMAGGTDAQPGAPPLVIGTTAPRSMSLSAGPPGPPAPLTRDERAKAEQQARPGAVPGEQAAAGATAPASPVVIQPGDLSVTITAPPQASLGGNFTVSVALTDSGSATDGDVTLSFDPSLLQAVGPSSGRASVHLAQIAPGTLSGSVTFRAQAAGSGSASITFADGHVRMPDGTQLALSGGTVTVDIGL